MSLKASCMPGIELDAKVDPPWILVKTRCTKHNEHIDLMMATPDMSAWLLDKRDSEFSNSSLSYQKVT
jgi:hypothetical protein